VVVIMPKPRPTISIAHADDVPPIAFTDEVWQAIEHAYGRQLNADVRQQITTVATEYLKDCVFERTAAPKAMARKRLKRIRRAAGDLEKVMLDRAAFSVSSDELSEEQQQSAHSYANYLIRRYLGEARLARDKLHHFLGVLHTLVVACDCALNDLCAAQGVGDAWSWWIQGLTRIAQEHSLLTGVSTEPDKSGRPSPFVRLVQELDRCLPANARQRRSPAALAMAISRARNT
jgi:hypothetical protein